MAEKRYPQGIRGGAGYFPEAGKVVLEGYFGAEIELSGGSETSPIIPPANSGIVIHQGAFTLSWKRAGSKDHPNLFSQLVETRYIQIGAAAIGFDTTLYFTIEIFDTSKLGSGPNGKGWYFSPVQDFLKPDFDRGSTQSTGTFQLWVNDGHVDIVGGCKWSRNVGSGIDGILLNIDKGSQPVSESYPRMWPKGSKIRVKINYWVPEL